ncbi:hypothetical protein [Streptomyces sp. ISID311]|uniref:hypothetical protein n=1 Tax=Streptomyces sp. ISID311 TaxID=2601673 RepID=UPI0011BD426F|nr:hypothetical protein [Streptomyces sp. ISID311]TXC97417.1 hypothetical protein FS847_12900 [Streptomyces sp. ISID311]
MSAQSWDLRSRKRSIGTLFCIEIDQPWFRCEFTAGEGWEEVGGLFAAQAAATDSGDQEALMHAIGAVRNLEPELHPQEGKEIIKPVVIQIRGDKANFRY